MSDSTPQETLDRQIELYCSSIEYFLEARANQVQLWLVRFVEERLRGKCDNPPEFWLLMAEVLVGDGVRLLVETDED